VLREQPKFGRKVAGQAEPSMPSSGSRAAASARQRCDIDDGPAALEVLRNVSLRPLLSPALLLDDLPLDARGALLVRTVVSTKASYRRKAARVAAAVELKYSGGSMSPSGLRADR
jgi:hypothetical protein